jgi:hypothetical protein
MAATSILSSASASSNARRQQPPPRPGASAGRHEPTQRPSPPPFRSLFRAKRLQVALLAAHHVKPRFVAAKLRTERQFLGQRIEREMLLGRSALLEGAADDMMNETPESAVRTTVMP